MLEKRRFFLCCQISQLFCGSWIVIHFVKKKTAQICRNEKKIIILLIHIEPSIQFNCYLFADLKLWKIKVRNEHENSNRNWLINKS